MMQPNELFSPRLRSLSEAVENGHNAALELFWNEVEEHGEPLLEAIEGDDANLYATFLWRATEELDNVVIFSKLFMEGLRDRQTGKMERLLDTDVWYRTTIVRRDSRLTYSFTPNDSLLPPSQMENPIDYFGSTKISPYNPLNQIYESGSDELITRVFYPDGNEDHYGWYRSIMEGPDAPPQPHYAVRAGVPKGKLAGLSVRSEILANERTIGVYTPPGYDPSGQPYALLICFDGVAYVSDAFVPTPTILDNLLSEHAIPPAVALFIDHVVDGEDQRLSELLCNSEFNRFLTDELLPQVRERFNVTNDPELTLIAGSSAGGLGAAFAAFEYPEQFGNVLAQTGAFRFGGRGRPECWLIRQFVESERLPLSFYLDVGIYEDRGPGISALRVVRHFRDVLESKGYPVTYAEHSGGHDYVVWRQTLVDGLISLIGVDQGDPNKPDR
jgi:enterochelin esterase family protein